MKPGKCIKFPALYFMMQGIPTLLSEDVAELPRPAAVEAEDVIVPDDALVALRLPRDVDLEAALQLLDGALGLVIGVGLQLAPGARRTAGHRRWRRSWNVWKG